MKKKCDRGTKQDPAAQWSACRPAGHHADYPGSLSVHHLGGLQANARKTGDYESDRDQEFRNGHMELPTFLYHLFYLPRLFFFRISFQILFTVLKIHVPHIC